MEKIHNIRLLPVFDMGDPFLTDKVKSMRSTNGNIGTEIDSIGYANAIWMIVEFLESKLGSQKTELLIGRMRMENKRRKYGVFNKEWWMEG